MQTDKGQRPWYLLWIMGNEVGKCDIDRIVNGLMTFYFDQTRHLVCYRTLLLLSHICSWRF